MKSIKDRVIKSELVPWKKFEFIQSEKFKALSREAHDKLKNSILDNNFVESFKVWKHKNKLYCLDGYHRCQILEELITEGHRVPEKFRADFIRCKDRHEASRLVLIYSSIYANITEEGFLKYLEENNLTFEEVKMTVDIPNFNQEYFELKNFSFDIKEDGFDGESEYEKIKKPVTKKGDVFELGIHRLINGDCQIEDDVKGLMNGEKADLIFTDPPYNVDYKSPGGLSYDSKKYGDT
jgi:hypothetical protein